MLKFKNFLKIYQFSIKYKNQERINNFNLLYNL